MTYDYDLVVIGAGSAGLAAARRASSLGKKVAIAEKNHVGGTCANRGCIPTKLMVHAAELAQSFAITKSYGWGEYSPQFDWPSFKQSMDAHLQSIRDSLVEGLDDIELIRGEAQFVDAHTLEVDNKKITAEYILIAVGSKPMMPDLPGIEHAIDSKAALQLDELADSYVVVGGGYIGVEFAQIYRCFWKKVTLVDSNPYVLDGFDEAIQKRARETLESDGVMVIDEARLESIQKTADGFRTVLDNGKEIEAQQVLCALGRKPNTEQLNTDAVGIATKKGNVVVDEFKRTAVDNIFAVGDCTDTVMLTPVAKAEGEAAVDTMFGEARKVDCRWVPSAVFMHPEHAMVGPTESEAKEQEIKYEVVESTFTPLKYAMAEGADMTSHLKLLFTPESEEIISVHLSAPRAADLVQMLVPALKKGLTMSELRETIAIHPSTGEELFCL